MHQWTWLTNYTIFFTFIMGLINGWIANDSYRKYLKMKRKTSRG
jgi:hypothetical protein